MVVKNQKDFFAGIMFTVLGVAFAVGSRSYNMGDASHMGPGYFPFVLGIILAVLGLVVTLLSLRPANGGEQRVGRFAWKPLFYILAGNLVFGLCLGGLSVAGVTVFQPLGLVVGIYALVLIVSRAAQEYRFS
jgi:Tripartite tricarboxylate transporter TctB family